MNRPLPHRRGALDALRDNPEFRRLYFARTTSLLGDWLNTLAIIHLLGQGQETTALPLAVMFVFKQLPMALLGPAAGVVADRYDRRRTMIACDLVSAIMVLLFLLTEPGGSKLWIYGLTVLQIGVTTFFDPAYRAVMPDLVRADDLVTANALTSLTWSAVFAVGTALGGLVLYTLGWRAAFVLDALTYVLSAAFIAGVRNPATAPPRAPEGARAARPVLLRILAIDELRDGIRYVLSNRPVRGFIAIKPVWGLMGALSLFLTLLGSTPTHRLGNSGDLGIAFLWCARAIGTGIGPWIVRRWAEGDSRKLLRAIVAGFAVALSAYALLAASDSWWLTGLLVLVAHAGGATIWVMSTVLLQQTVPSAFRGRTFAAELGLVMFSSSFSTLVCAALIDHTSIGVHGAILASAAVTALPALLWSIAVALRPRSDPP